MTAERSSRSMLGLSLILALGMLSGLMLVGTPAQADPVTDILYNLTSDHCTGTCGPDGTIFGMVRLTQNGTSVDVTVDLADGYSYAKTGAADDQAFKFNGDNVVLGDITVDAHVPGLVAAAGAFNGDGTGEFDFGINCPTCGGGGSSAFTNNIVFHVADATIADLTQPNNLGNLFVADVLAPNGNTGPVDVSTPGTPVPEPGTLLLLGSGLASVGAWTRRRMRRRA